jgi:hypothetical protein
MGEDESPTLSGRAEELKYLQPLPPEKGGCRKEDIRRRSSWVCRLGKAGERLPIDVEVGISEVAYYAWRKRGAVEKRDFA